MPRKKAQTAAAASASAAMPPVAERRPQTRTFGGVEVADDYAWLENPDDPDVIAYLEAENAYRAAVTAPVADLEETLYQEMLGRVQQTDTTAPVPWDGWHYYERTEEGLQYPILARRRGADGPEEVLLDLNRMLRTGYISLRGWEPSPDHTKLAYLLNETGGLEETLRVKDLATGTTLPDEFEHAADVAWANDNATFFWLRQDDALRSHQLLRHRLGDDPAHDELIYTEEDEVFDLGLDRSNDGHVVFLTSACAESSEVRYRSADRPEGRWALFAARQPDVLYFLEHLGGDFLIRTNADGATNFKLERAPVLHPDERDTVIAHDPIRLVSGIDVHEQYLVVEGRSNANAQVWVLPHGGEMTMLPFDEAAFDVELARNPTFASDTFRVAYSSPVTPKTVFEVNARSGERSVVKQDVVPSGHDPARYRVERLWAKAKDGERIPITILRLADRADRPGPLLLYGYGSYGLSSDPAFRSSHLSLVDRGVAFAIAHIRGGQERGRFWYEEGKLLRKTNTFTDFVAVAEHLVEQGVADRERIAYGGGSAGGLLMGAVVNLRPDLPRAVVAWVPFVDVLRVMLDPSLPLTTGEFVEWGNPAEPEYRDYIAAYSPYDHVVHHRYPSMLITGGIADDQVPYWQPAKWTAKLRTMQHGDHPILLRMVMGAGHGGASGRYDRLRETAGDWAFVLRELGAADVAPASVAGLNPEVAPPATGMAAALLGGPARPAPEAAERPTAGDAGQLPPNTIAWGHAIDGTVDPRAKTLDDIKGRVGKLLHPGKDDEQA